MSAPAQRPPESTSALERVGKAITELLLLALSALAGMSVVIALMWAGVLPDGTTDAWAAVIAGPILIGTAGLSYLLLERTVLGAADPPRPLASLG